MIKPLVVAAGLLALGVAILGVDWSGVEVEPGVWRDGVSPGRWVLFGAVLFVVGVVVWTVSDPWWQRLLVLVPLLAWYTWQLRHGSIWPIALAIYGGATVTLWLAGSLVSDVWRRRATAPEP